MHESFPRATKNVLKGYENDKPYFLFSKQSHPLVYKTFLRLFESFARGYASFYHMASTLSIPKSRRLLPAIDLFICYTQPVAASLRQGC